jgi:hypothetical protein
MVYLVGLLLLMLLLRGGASVFTWEGRNSANMFWLAIATFELALILGGLVSDARERIKTLEADTQDSMYLHDKVNILEAQICVLDPDCTPAHFPDYR